MSTDLTFVALEHDDAAMLIADPTCVDDFVDREHGFQSVLVLAGRWDQLHQALSGAGFRSSHFIDEVLANGCEVVEPDLVFRQAQDLAKVDEAQLRHRLLGALSDPREVEAQCKAYSDLSAFYANASARSLGIIFFAQ